TSGLTAIEQCLDNDLVPVCFEQNSFIGGLWRYEEVCGENKDPHSSIYESIRTNTSKEMTAFSDFPIPRDWPTFLSHYYIERDKEEEEIFDYVMVCSGHHRHHRWPKYKGMDAFRGEQTHSHFYRKRRLTEKAITEESGPYPPHLKPNEPPFASYSVVNSEIFRRLAAGAVVVKPDIKELKSDNNKIEFADGTVLENIDVVIYSTGYYLEFPFLEKDIITGGKDIEKEYAKEYKEDLVWMYKRMFPPRYPNIAFVGLVVGAGAIFPIRWVL
ncbi:7744_t:CDS:2, partial [Acaulospora colombiana]